MKETQLNLLRISFGVLSFLLYLKATTTATLADASGGNELQRKRWEFATQPRGIARQYHQRRLQPFNALLTPTGQLADGLYRHNDEHSALTKTLANKHTRFVRAADDAEESTAASQWFGENFGQMMQTLAQWMGLVINVIWKLFE